MSGEGERLARIEARVETMADDMRSMRKLMERIVRVEEHNANHESAIKRIGNRLDAIENDIADISKKLHRNSWTVLRWERYLWLGVTTAFGLLLWKLKVIL